MVESGLEIARSISQLRRAIGAWRAAGARVALVPTMGALHAGHLKLIEVARRHADRIVVSIFVNPKQFGPREDFAAYPRAEAADTAKAGGAGADLAFIPPVEAVYPAGFATTVTVGGVSEGLCGAQRPGHFAGVATVVAKLLLQALPDFAIFGEKDYQQLQVVKRMVRDLDLPVAIIGVPTVREPDGLALSSRNVLLSPEERRIAPVLARTLLRMADVLADDGAAVAPQLAWGRATLAQSGFAVEYLEMRAADDLAPVERIDGPARILAAVRLGTTRLIDNVAVARAPS
jgi:pantoate--beta-alanine ligase